MLIEMIAFLLVGGVEPSNPLFRELVDKGLPLPAGSSLRLPRPWMTDGLTREQQHAVLEKAAGDLPLDLFVKDTLAAPFALKINSVNDAAGKRVAQTLDLAFVAHGTLERVIKEDVLNKLIGTDAKKGKDVDSVKVLSEDMLREAGIKLLQGPNLEERDAGLEIFFLDRVKINGVTRNVKTHGPDWAVLAMQLDPRFENDKRYPNRWRSFNPIEETFGPPQVYSGLGGYARVTKLAEPKGSLFFELHVGLHEPEAWFGGPNLLRSKLPLIFKENVPKLRRKLARD